LLLGLILNYCEKLPKRKLINKFKPKIAVDTKLCLKQALKRELKVIYERRFTLNIFEYAVFFLKFMFC